MVRKDTIPAAAAFSYPAAVSRVKQLQLQVLEQRAVRLLLDLQIWTNSRSGDLGFRARSVRLLSRSLKKSDFGGASK